MSTPDFPAYARFFVVQDLTDLSNFVGFIQNDLDELVVLRSGSPIAQEANSEQVQTILARLKSEVIEEITISAVQGRALLEATDARFDRDELDDIQELRTKMQTQLNALSLG